MNRVVSTLIVFALAKVAGAQLKDTHQRMTANGPSLPATCTAGQMFIKTNGSTGGKLYTGVGSSPCVWEAAAFRAGDYNAMTACFATTECPVWSMWLLTNAQSSGLCTSGGAANTAFALCIKDGNGVGQPILAVTGSGGTSGGGGGGGGTTTIYGGYTGGGSTVTVSDSDCAGGDDTSAVQAKLDAVTNNGTLDFTNTTNSCDINTAGLYRSGMTNIRVTHSPTTHPTNGDIRGIASGFYSTEYSSVFELNLCTNCLVDKLVINVNSTQGQGFFCHRCTSSSAQNLEIKNGGTDPSSPAGAGLRFDFGTDNFMVSNNVHDLGGVSSGHGLRGIWAGSGTTEFEVRPTIKDNTVTNTGHTGIVTESQGPIVTGNLVTNAITQGSGMKFIHRGSTSVDAVFDNNSVVRTAGAGLQIERSASGSPTNTFVRNNQFRDICDQTVAPGQTFASLYLSGGSTGTVQNVKFTGNTSTNGMIQAQMNNAANILLSNNNIVTPASNDGATVVLESSVSNVTVTDSGTVVMWNGCNPATGGNCSNIYQNGVRLALVGPFSGRDVVVVLAE